MHDDKTHHPTNAEADDMTDTPRDIAHTTRPWVAHGGNLSEAVQRYGFARDAWLDLSTGINPHGYPAPPVSAQAWQRLPDDDDGLNELAARHYGATYALAVAGSQAVIRALPALLQHSPNASRLMAHGTARVTGIATLTYGEYLPAFQRAGHRILRYTCIETERAARETELPSAQHEILQTHLQTRPHTQSQADFVLSADQALPAELHHLVVVNPNNPTTTLFSREVILDWHAQLAARGGSLIVDEAFSDASPGYSVAQEANQTGLIVLRSIGKFFGLAGARAGFVLAHPTWLAQLRAELGPWTLSGPAREAVRSALLDGRWQQATQAQLSQDGARLVQLLCRHGFAARSTPLFAWLPHPQAAALQERLARHAIWVRLFDSPPSLRLGLPASEADWQRLDTALRDCADLLPATAP